MVKNSVIFEGFFAKRRGRDQNRRFRALSWASEEGDRWPGTACKHALRWAHDWGGSGGGEVLGGKSDFKCSLWAAFLRLCGLQAAFSSVVDIYLKNN